MLKFCVYRVLSFLLLSQLSCQGWHPSCSDSSNQLFGHICSLWSLSRILEGLRCRGAAFPPRGSLFKGTDWNRSWNQEKKSVHLNFYMLTAGLHTFLLLLNLFKFSLAWLSGDKPLPPSSANYIYQMSHRSSNQYVASPGSSARIIWRLSWGIQGNRKALFTLSADSLLPCCYITWKHWPLQQLCGPPVVLSALHQGLVLGGSSLVRVLAACTINVYRVRFLCAYLVAKGKCFQFP